MAKLSLQRGRPLKYPQEIANLVLRLRTKENKSWGLIASDLKIPVGSLRDLAKRGIPSGPDAGGTGSKEEGNE